jgi:hypothetical protein
MKEGIATAKYGPQIRITEKPDAARDEKREEDRLAAEAKETKMITLLESVPKMMLYLGQVQQKMLEGSSDEAKAETVQTDILPLIDAAIQEGKYDQISRITNKIMSSVTATKDSYKLMGLDREIDRDAFDAKKSQILMYMAMRQPNTVKPLRGVQKDLELSTIIRYMADPANDYKIDLEEMLMSNQYGTFPQRSESAGSDEE